MRGPLERVARELRTQALAELGDGMIDWLLEPLTASLPRAVLEAPPIQALPEGSRVSIPVSDRDKEQV